MSRFFTGCSAHLRICRAVSVVTILLLWLAVLWIELRVCAGMTLMLFMLYIAVFYSENCKF